METTIFYETFFLNQIIVPYFFKNKNYGKNKEIKEFIIKRMVFMDRFKIIVGIAKENKIKSFNKIGDFIKLRNDIAHNFSEVREYYFKDGKHKGIIGGKEMEWSEYLSTIKKWAKLSLELAKFTMKLYSAAIVKEKFTCFCYCKVESDLLLIQHNLIFPKPEGDYTSFVHNGLDSMLLKYINEEKEFKECDLNK